MGVLGQGPRPWEDAQKGKTEMDNYALQSKNGLMRKAHGGPEEEKSRGTLVSIIPESTPSSCTYVIGTIVL